MKVVQKERYRELKMQVERGEKQRKEKEQWSREDIAPAPATARTLYAGGEKKCERNALI